MPKEALTTLTDVDGDVLGVWAEDGYVYVSVPVKYAVLGPEQQEQMGQAYIAACNAADRQNGASRAWPIAPHACDGEQICSAETQASPEEGDVWYCTAAAGHEPMQHGAYRASGDLVAHWPVSRG